MKSAKFSEAQVEDLALAVGLVVRRVRARAPAEAREITWTQKSVLLRLGREGAASSAELARAEGVTPQSMGTAISVLEEMGLVERESDPRDGRRILIKPTAKANSLRQLSKTAKDTWLTQALDKLEPEELSVLFKAGEIMKRMAEKP